MSILKTEIGIAIPNFLDSEVGLVTKTAQIPQSMGQTDGDRKTVFAGTVFPTNTSAATGIVFQDVDVTRWRRDRRCHGCRSRNQRPRERRKRRADRAQEHRLCRRECDRPRLFRHLREGRRHG